MFLGKCKCFEKRLNVINKNSYNMKEVIKVCINYLTLKDTAQTNQCPFVFTLFYGVRTKGWQISDN